MTRFLWYYCFLFACLQLAYPAYAEKLCPSLDIRSVEDFALLRSCSIIVGHVSITNVQLPPTVAQFNFSSSIVEITDYLLVYRVHGLSSLQQILPQLIIIRGRELLFEKYALIVHENRNLLDLGLTSLLRIQYGSIRIEANPVLCFVDTVNWVQLLGNSTQQHFSFKRNKPPNYCPLCVAENDTGLNGHCWNLQNYQRQPYTARLSPCPAYCGTSGCNARGVCCGPYCLTECSDINCRVCAHYRNANKCVKECIFPFFELNKRECISTNTCHHQNLVPYAGVCLESCPDNYIKVNEINGMTTCSPQCSGTFIINKAEDLYKLKDCIAIKGSLIVELKDLKTHIITELERVLANLKEISGYLQIKRSPQLVSLNFLQNLDNIGGNELIDNKYSLYIVDNHHLEQIWSVNQKVAILKGRVYFHLNPRLCHDKIMQLEASLKNVTKITIEDASPNSNGERVICGSAVRVLEAKVEDFNSTAALIKVEPMSSDDIDVLLGYLHHYKEAPQRNVSMYDGRHGCGHDNWRMDITASKNIRHIISNLKPYTQYAYFVKTLTRTDYHMQIDAYSKIQYFWTLSSKPGPVAKIYYTSLSATEIVVHWWPPKNPNGIIKNYYISYDKAAPLHLNATKPAKNYPTQARPNHYLEVCQCTNNESGSSGPTPEDENYYNKEQITYEEALPNLIYVPRSATELSKNHVYKKKDKVNATSSNESTPINDSSSSNESEAPILKRPARKSDDLEHNVNTIEETASSDFFSKDSKDKFDKESAKKTSDGNNNGESVVDRLSRYRQDLDLKVLQEQDTSSKDFPILKPLPTCSVSNPSVQHQLENLCKPMEHYSGIKVAGHQHSFVLRQLLPEQTYLISIRACVEGLENGCGCESTILAETVSKRMETFLKEFRAFN